MAHAAATTMIVACTGATAAHAQPRAGDSVIWLRAPVTPDVAWRGMLPTEGGAVGSGPQIGPYVVPNPAGLLVAILTHATIQSGVNSSIKKREQEEADRVLEPYQGALKAWPAAALWQAALADRAADKPLQMWEGAGSAPTGRSIEAVPLFSMSQDEAVLVLDLLIQPRADGSEPIGRGTTVRVISSPLRLAGPVAVAETAAASASLPAASAPPMPLAATAAAAASAPMTPPPERAHWLAQDAQALKRTAAAMFAHAVQLSQSHAGIDSAEPPMRTHRYQQGKVLRSERASQLAGDCQRVVLRTLRGALMSAPLSADPACTVEAAF